jgi:hypothetical protein
MDRDEKKAVRKEKAEAREGGGHTTDLSRFKGRFDLRFNLRFGAGVIMTTHSLALT